MPRYTVTTDLLLYLSREVEAETPEEAEQLIRDEVDDLLYRDDLPVRVTGYTILEAHGGWDIGLYHGEEALDPATVQATLSGEDEE